MPFIDGKGNPATSQQVIYHRSSQAPLKVGVVKETWIPKCHLGPRRRRGLRALRNSAYKPLALSRITLSRGDDPDRGRASEGTVEDSEPMRSDGNGQRGGQGTEEFAGSQRFRSFPRGVSLRPAPGAPEAPHAGAQAGYASGPWYARESRLVSL